MSLSPAIYSLCVTLDDSVLAANSTDCLILSRKVNGTFSTALAVGSLGPLAFDTGRFNEPQQVLARSYFCWRDAFRVLIVREALGGALVSQ